MSHLKIWRFWGYIKSWLHLWSFQMNSGAGALWDEQNVTKIKAIGPCVQELEAKMRVKLALLVVTLFWLGSILPSISPKLWIMRIWFIVYHFPDPWPNYIHQLWTSSYPHLSGGIFASDSKARARARGAYHICYPQNRTKKVWGLVGISSKSTHGLHIMAVKCYPQVLHTLSCEDSKARASAARSHIKGQLEVTLTFWPSPITDLWSFR